jgi:hypothetical protein
MEKRNRIEEREMSRQHDEDRGAEGSAEALLARRDVLRQRRGELKRVYDGRARRICLIASGGGILLLALGLALAGMRYEVFCGAGVAVYLGLAVAVQNRTYNETFEQLRQADATLRQMQDELYELDALPAAERQEVEQRRAVGNLLKSGWAVAFILGLVAGCLWFVFLLAALLPKGSMRGVEGRIGECGATAAVFSAMELAWLLWLRARLRGPLGRTPSLRQTVKMLWAELS